MKTTGIDPKDFWLSDEQVREHAAQQRGGDSKPKSKPKRGIEFYQFPEAVMDAIRRTNYMPALALAMAVYKGWYLDFKKRNPVKLTSALLVEFAISRDQKRKGLKILEQTGLFLVERFPGHNPLVTMTWKLIKD
jgi:hypothetical protein